VDVDIEMLGQQVLKPTAFDDLQTIVARGERLTLWADPGRDDENACVTATFLAEKPQCVRTGRSPVRREGSAIESSGREA